MAHLGTLHDFAFEKDADDIRGTVLYGLNDEKLGKVEDVIFDHSSGELRYLVVDTGGWFTHKRFLVPTNRVHSYDEDRDAFQVDLTKQQVEDRFPRFDEEQLKSERDWANYEEHYREAWDVDPVQHQDSRVDLDVTPATIEAGTSATGTPNARDIRMAQVEEVPLGSLGEEISPDVEEAAERDPELHSGRERYIEEDIASRDLTPNRIAGKFPGTAPGSEKLHMVPNVAGERELGQNSETSPKVSQGVPADEPVRAQQGERKVIRTTDVGQWHPRMRRFEDLLKKNRVDVTASCASCAPAKDRVA